MSFPPYVPASLLYPNIATGILPPPPCIVFPPHVLTTASAVALWGGNPTVRSKATTVNSYLLNLFLLGIVVIVPSASSTLEGGVRTPVPVSSAVDADVFI